MVLPGLWARLETGGGVNAWWRKGWWRVFSITVTIGDDSFSMTNVPDEYFAMVLEALEIWYRERKPLPVIHGTLVFDPPTEQVS